MPQLTDVFDDKDAPLGEMDKLSKTKDLTSNVNSSHLDPHDADLKPDHITHIANSVPSVHHVTSAGHDSLGHSNPHHAHSNIPPSLDLYKKEVLNDEPHMTSKYTHRSDDGEKKNGMEVMKSILIQIPELIVQLFKLLLDAFKNFFQLFLGIFDHLFTLLRSLVEKLPEIIRNLSLGIVYILLVLGGFGILISVLFLSFGDTSSLDNFWYNNEKILDIKEKYLGIQKPQNESSLSVDKGEIIEIQTYYPEVQIDKN